MTLHSIRHIEAQKIIREITTVGSSPLQILGNDIQVYFAKTNIPKFPHIELINEVLCGYLAQCWNLKVPNFTLLKIDDEVVKKYEFEGGKLSSRYKLDSFGENLFFASQIVKNSTELEKYNQNVQKSDFNNFASPLDLVKIGVFDFWIGNKDRKPENPNILIGTNGKMFNFYPIDHTAAFAFLEDYKQVRDILLAIEPKNNILSAPIVRSITNFVSPNLKAGLKDEILFGIEVALDNLDFIFQQIPYDWGLSKKSKLHLKAFLADNDRNNRIANSYLAYLK